MTFQTIDEYWLNVRLTLAKLIALGKADKIKHPRELVNTALDLVDESDEILNKNQIKLVKGNDEQTY